ncbi:MAG: PIN domain-containing protein [Clostridia bacterium]|nr:PIN domain-containing protein [Clostridia bacterium]
MVILDANMILRYLLNDNQEMADSAERYLNSGDVSVTIEVIAEVVYVLKGVYSMKRDVIVDTVKAFLGFVNCQETDVLSIALDTYGERNLDFVDCVLYGYHCVRGAEIATFDKKLLKLLADSAK